MNIKEQPQITVIDQNQIQIYYEKFLLFNERPPKGKFIAILDNGLTACMDTTFFKDGKPVYNTWQNSDLAFDWLKNIKPYQN